MRERESVCVRMGMCVYMIVFVRIYIYMEGK